MNWSCQSSVFICLDPESARTLGYTAGKVHAAHWYMQEHVPPPCGLGCALRPLVGRKVQMLEDLQLQGVHHLVDWPKSEFAAYIFGGNEPPGRFFTAAHEFVIIDAEQMFSTGPCSFDTAFWLKRPDGTSSKSGTALATEVCREVGGLSDSVISQALSIPVGIEIELHWSIASKLQESVKFSSAYARAHTVA
ncbi:MAG: hypothetical protein KJS98_19835, partial [Nitrospirae bacterium]|nr:hypothetical protein [Nitrospirota bacterium]